MTTPEMDVFAEAITPATRREAIRLVDRSDLDGISKARLVVAIKQNRGWLFRIGSGQSVAVGAHAGSTVVDGYRHFKIELPAAEVGFTRYGLKCPLRVMAVIALLHEVQRECPLGRIEMAFESGQPPSLGSILDVGLCRLMKKERAPGWRPPQGPVEFHEMNLELLPVICRAIVKLMSQPYAGSSGLRGSVRVFSHESGLPFSRSKLSLIQSIADGMMSSIGLWDTDWPQVG